MRRAALLGICWGLAWWLARPMLALAQSSEGTGDTPAEGSGDASVPGPCEIWTDRGLDGVEKREILSYGESGTLVSLETDGDNDGTIESISSYTYSDHPPCLLPGTGVPHRSCPDGYETTGTDGTPQNRSRYTFDPDGRLASLEFWEFRSGQDQISTRHFNYDALGRLRDSWVDEDGEMTGRTVFIYYDDGLWPARAGVDYGPDGDVDQACTFVYDTQGRLISQDIDSNEDSVVDIRMTYNYGCWDSP